jgi:hypothetical protein
VLSSLYVVAHFNKMNPQRLNDDNILFYTLCSVSVNDLYDFNLIARARHNTVQSAESQVTFPEEHVASIFMVEK